MAVRPSPKAASLLGTFTILLLCVVA